MAIFSFQYTVSLRPFRPLMMFTHSAMASEEGGASSDLDLATWAYVYKIEYSTQWITHYGRAQILRNARREAGYRLLAPQPANEDV